MSSFEFWLFFLAGIAFILSLVMIRKVSNIRALERESLQFEQTTQSEVFSNPDWYNDNLAEPYEAPDDHEFVIDEDARMYPTGIVCQVPESLANDPSKSVIRKRDAKGRFLPGEPKAKAEPKPRVRDPKTGRFMKRAA